MKEEEEAHSAKERKGGEGVDRSRERERGKRGDGSVLRWWSRVEEERKDGRVNEEMERKEMAANGWYGWCGWYMPSVSLTTTCLKRQSCPGFCSLGVTCLFPALRRLPITPYLPTHAEPLPSLIVSNFPPFFIWIWQLPAPSTDSSLLISQHASFPYHPSCRDIQIDLSHIPQ